MSYSELGGGITYIEAREFTFKKERKEKPVQGQLKVTGSLGDVMKESVVIAHTLAKNFLLTHLPDSPAAAYLENEDVHIHVPEGAVQKVSYNPIIRFRKDLQLERQLQRHLLV